MEFETGSRRHTCHFDNDNSSPNPPRFNRSNLKSKQTEQLITITHNKPPFIILIIYPCQSEISLQPHSHAHRIKYYPKPTIEKLLSVIIEHNMLRVPSKEMPYT